MTLEQAQTAKMRLVAEKLDLKPGGGELREEKLVLKC
jgi:cyclopropane fatty-acyl-phospholipid synthase-like methyltransferase